MQEAVAQLSWDRIARLQCKILQFQRCRAVRAEVYMSFLGSMSSTIGLKKVDPVEDALDTTMLFGSISVPKQDADHSGGSGGSTIAGLVADINELVSRISSGGGLGSDQHDRC